MTEIAKASVRENTFHYVINTVMAAEFGGLQFQI